MKRLMLNDPRWVLCATLTLACEATDDDVFDGGHPEAIDADLEDEAAALDEGSDGSGFDEAELDEDDEAIEHADAIEDADDPRLATTVDPQAVASTDPLLGWVLYSQPGVARLVQVDPATGVASTTRTHVFSSHWNPVGVAGDKLLWQRTDTGETSLWTIDAGGNYVTHVTFQPDPGWNARGISFDQEGECPMPAAAQRSYTILWEGTAPGIISPPPPPVLWHLDDAGAITSSESFPVTYSSWAQLRDFRLTAHGYGALIYQYSLALVGDGTTIDWYGRDQNGALLRLRTDTYSATEGNVACTAHEPNVQCFFDLGDEIPGAGHTLTSMVTTAASGGYNLPASYLLWTEDDGTAKAYRLGLYSGKLLAPEAPIVTPHAGSSAVSLTGRPPTVCPIVVGPQDPPPQLPGDPVLDPPGCPWC